MTKHSERGELPVTCEVGVILESTITCPHCGHQATETMAMDACQYLYDCKACGQVLKPKRGDCCVYCSYGSMPCPPVQVDAGCCG